MPYRTMGWIHANVARLWRDQRGQGTVEYVGLMLLLATLLTGVVAAAEGLKGGGLAKEIVNDAQGDDRRRRSRRRSRPRGAPCRERRLETPARTLRAPPSGSAAAGRRRRPAQS